MYLGFKWFHLVAVISWMAGILYLFRLLVYLAERGSNPEIHDLLSLMARRLYRYITLPAMVASYIGGIGMLAMSPALLSTGWVLVKIVMILGLTATSLYAGQLVTRFANRAPCVPTGRQLRMLNEVPTLLMLIIVALAVFRWF